MSNIQTSESEPSNVIQAVVQAPAGHEAPIGFFAIGLVINLVLIAAFLLMTHGMVDQLLGNAPTERQRRGLTYRLQHPDFAQISTD